MHTPAWCQAIRLESVRMELPFELMRMLLMAVHLMADNAVLPTQCHQPTVTP